MERKNNHLLLSTSRFGTFRRSRTVLVYVFTLLIACAVGFQSYPAYAEGEGVGANSGNPGDISQIANPADEVIIINSEEGDDNGPIIIDTGDDLNIPDEDFGLSDDKSASPRGILTGELKYTYTYSTQNDDNSLNWDGALFDITKEKHLFLLNLCYDYNLRNSDRIYIGANLSENNDGAGLKLNLELSEAFANLDLKNAGKVILGKQKLNFGLGYGWTPTGIYLNSLDLDGVTSVRWTIPYWKLGVTSVVIPPLAELEKVQLYERVDLTLNKLNLALSGYVEDKGKARFGLDASGFIGDVELYTALSAKPENTRKYVEVGTMPDPLDPQNSTLNTYDFVAKDSDWYLTGILGATYTIPKTNNTFVMLEYYYDPTGLTQDQIAAIADAATYSTDIMQNETYQKIKIPMSNMTFADIYRGYLGQLNNYFKPGQMGRNYLFCGVQNVELAKPVKFNLVGIANLDDRSGVLNPELSYKLTDSTSLSFCGNLFFGETKSEYGLRAVERVIKFGTTTHF